MTRLTTLDLPSYYKATIGFDRIFDELERTFAISQSNSYPPYNIAKIDENEFIISLAVAGFTMEDLEITKEANVLRIEGSSPKGEEQVNYLHKGIGSRNFRREFALADHVEVVDAKLSVGMLDIRLRREIPEALQPKKIEITSGDEYTIRYTK